MAARRAFAVASGASSTTFEKHVAGAAAQLESDGVALFPPEFNVNRIEPGFVLNASKIVDRAFSDALDRAARFRGKQRSAAPSSHEDTSDGEKIIPVGQKHGFREIVHRARGRYDMLHGIWGHPALVSESALYRAVLLPAAQKVLGEDCRLEFNGALMTTSGAAEQLWHVDGQHLFPVDPQQVAQEASGSGCGREVETVLPPHCVNFFVPLVDIPDDPSVGGTEFCLGSHKRTNKLGPDAVWQRADWREKLKPEWDGEIVKVKAQAGQLMCFEYRILHRAMAHNVATARPVLYWTFVRPWFTDALNFAGLPSLGGVESGSAELNKNSAPSWVKRIRAEQYAASVHKSGPSKNTYADGAAGSQLPRVVADAMHAYMLENGNTNLGGAYVTSEKARATVTKARAAAAALLGCVDGRYVAFGANCTNLMFHLAGTLGEYVEKQAARAGGVEKVAKLNIVVSRACHDANVAPWLGMASGKLGIEVRWIEVGGGDAGDELDFRSDGGGSASASTGIQNLIDENTVLVAVGLASNVTGRVHWPNIRERIVARAEELRGKMGAYCLVEVFFLNSFSDERTYRSHFL
eukprot:g17680.t1